MTFPFFQQFILVVLQRKMPLNVINFSSYCYFLSRQFSCFCLCFLYTTFSMIHPISHGACALLRQSSNPAITELLIYFPGFIIRHKHLHLSWMIESISTYLVLPSHSYINPFSQLLFYFRIAEGLGPIPLNGCPASANLDARTTGLFSPLTLPLYHLHYFIFYMFL